MRRSALMGLFLAGMLLAAAAGCGSGTATQARPGASYQGPQPSGSEQARLKNALTGGQMTPSEVADMSDRLLAQSSTFTDQKTMARLELLLLMAIKSPDKSAQAPLWRNLGILHYHQQKYQGGAPGTPDLQRNQSQKRPHPLLSGPPLHPRGRDLRAPGAERQIPAAIQAGRHRNGAGPED